MPRACLSLPASSSSLSGGNELTDPSTGHGTEGAGRHVDIRPIHNPRKLPTHRCGRTIDRRTKVRAAMIGLARIVVLQTDSFPGSYFPGS